MAAKAEQAAHHFRETVSALAKLNAGLLRMLASRHPELRPDIARLLLDTRASIVDPDMLEFLDRELSDVLTPPPPPLRLAMVSGTNIKPR